MRTYFPHILRFPRAVRLLFAGRCKKNPSRPGGIFCSSGKALGALLEIATGGKTALAMTVGARVIAGSEATWCVCYLSLRGGRSPTWHTRHVIARRAQPDVAI